MKKFLAALAMLSFSAAAETVLLSSEKLPISEARVGALPADQGSTDNYSYRYKGATTHLHAADVSVSDNGMLILERLIIHSFYDGLEGENSVRVKSNNIIKVDKIVKDGTRQYSKAFIYVNLMKPKEIISMGDLGSDLKVAEQKIAAALTKVLLPEKLDAPTVDSLYEYRIDEKGDDNIRKALIERRTTDISKLVGSAIPVIAKKATQKSIYSVLPGFITDGYELRTTKVEGESYSQAVPKGSDTANVDAVVRGIKFKEGAVALTEQNATQWLQAFLESQVKESVSGPYSKADGVIAYRASKEEREAIANTLGAEAEGALSLDPSKLEITYASKVRGDVTSQFIQVKMALKVGDETSELTARYLLGAKSLTLVEVAIGERVVTAESAPKLLARDMKNMLLRSLVPSSMLDSKGNFADGVSAGLSAGDDDGNPFADEVSTGGYLIIKK